MSLYMRQVCCKNKKHNKNSLAGTSFCTSLPGFYVVEAAVAIPVFTVFMVSILFFFTILQTQMECQASLNYAGKVLAEQAALEKDKDEAAILQQTKAKLIFLSHLKKQQKNLEHIVEKEAGLHINTTDSDLEYVYLKLSYRIRFPVNLLGRHSYTVRQQVKVRKWKGDAARVQEAGEWVYITANGTAYHESITCPYLDLSIRSVGIQEVSRLRNQSGGVYYPCTECNVAAKEQVYITNYGTLYHTGLSCTGLKRSIQRVKRTEVKDKHVCPKCGR